MLVSRLARIHAKYGVYPSRFLSGEVDRSIVKDIREIIELSYLAAFYDRYYLDYIRSEKEVLPRSQPLNGAARSIDLPFIGSEVVKHGKAKYMFIFEGSLQNENYLSMTILSCFWVFTDIHKHEHLMKRYWGKLTTYNRIIRELGITPAVAKHSYVADGFRIGNQNGNRDTKKNRKLLCEEIELLNPDLIVLVGSTARDIVGPKTIDKDNRFITVPFPANRIPKVTQAMAPALYAVLRERIKTREGNRN